MKKSILLLLLTICFICRPVFSDRIKGDINGDSLIDINDIILSLKVISGMPVQSELNLNADGNGDGKIGLLDISYIYSKILNNNDYPNSVDDINSTDEDTLITCDAKKGVISNDSDVNVGDKLNVIQYTNGTKIVNAGREIPGNNGGKFVINKDGGYTFDPGASFQELSSGDIKDTQISYTISDGNGGTATANLIITVTGVNDLIFNVPDDYPTIQEAIDAATEGDTVMVAAGTYFENVNIKKGLTLQGTGGSLSTPDDETDDSIIDANENGRAVDMSTRTTLSGFTVRNGRGAYSGGNIKSYGSSVIIKDNLIEKGRTTRTGGYGGGIYLSGDNSKILNNIIKNNWAWASGGGIQVSGSSVIIEGNQILYNYSDWAGGIYSGSKSVLISKNIIDGNHADYTSGGGIYIASGSSVVENNTIVHNRRTHGHGSAIYIANNVSEIRNNIIAFNDVYCKENSYSHPQYILIEYNILYRYYYGQDYEGCEAGEGSISENPLFVESENKDFHLKDDSPAIDTGHPNANYNDPEDPDNPGYALYPAKATIRNDMGVYGSEEKQLSFFVVNNIYIIGKNKVLTTDAEEGILANDINLKEDATATMVEDVSHGTLLLKSDGSLTYTPNKDFTGEDSFIYESNNVSESETDTATVKIYVNEQPRIRITEPSGTVTVDDIFLIKWEDHDPDSNANISLYYDNDNMDQDGSIIGWWRFLDEDDDKNEYEWDTSVIMPEGEYYIYAVIDDGVNEPIVDYSDGVVIIEHNNIPPIAVDDFYTVDRNNKLRVDPENGLLANDSDENDDKIVKILIVDDVSNGTLSMHYSVGGFDYTPEADFVGEDIFTYKISDGLAESNIATVTITVNGVSLPPSITIIEPDGVDDEADYGYNITWIDEDPDSNAKISLYYDTDNIGQDGTLIIENTYEDYESDSYRWYTDKIDEGDYYIYATIDDGVNEKEINYSTGMITVTHNKPPVTQNQELETSKNTAKKITLLSQDPDGDSLTYTILSSPENGIIEGEVPNLIYTPNDNFVGIDNFTYKVNDGKEDSITATITIQVIDNDFLKKLLSDTYNYFVDMENVHGKGLTENWLDNNGNKGNYSSPEEAGFYMLSHIGAYENNLITLDVAFERIIKTINTLNDLKAYKPESEVIWIIGQDEAPPDYSEKAFDEFDNSPPFVTDFKVGSDPINSFPRELNDGDFQCITISFDLTEEQKNNDLVLYLDTLHASHDEVDSFEISVSVNHNVLGNHLFSSKGGKYTESKNITLSKDLLLLGENTIKLDNANKIKSGHWMLWDSLKLSRKLQDEGLFYRFYYTDTLSPNDTNVPSIGNAMLLASLITIRNFANAYHKNDLANDLAILSNGIITRINLKTFWDESEKLFWHNLDRANHWDHYSDEGRLLSFIAYALNQISVQDLKDNINALNKPALYYDISNGNTIGNSNDPEDILVDKASWDGSMFTYLVPSLFIKEHTTDYMISTSNPAIKAQIEYSKNKGYKLNSDYVWGISDALDTSGNYSCCEFQGAPPSAAFFDSKNTYEVCPGLITPYASALALITDYSKQAIDNLIILSDYDGLYDDKYGFRDSVDVLNNEISNKILTLDQEWIFLSIINKLDETVWKYFYEDQGVINAHDFMYGNL